MKIKMVPSLFALFLGLGILGALLQNNSLVSGHLLSSSPIPRRIVIHQAHNNIQVADDGIETHGGGGGNKGGGTHWHS